VSESLDTGAGIAAAGLRAGADLARLALWPARLATRAPVIGPPVRRLRRDLARDGMLSRARARARVEHAVGVLLAAPEVERAIDRVLAGTLTDAVARSLARNRVPERVAAEILATVDVEELIGSVLEHELTGRVVDRTLASSEMDRIVEYVATSPHILEAVSRHTQTLAEELATDVRRRSQVADDLAERAVRGWLRRPRQQPS
jgi:hypothetical protein